MGGRLPTPAGDHRGREREGALPEGRLARAAFRSSPPDISPIPGRASRSGFTVLRTNEGPSPTSPLPEELFGQRFNEWVPSAAASRAANGLASSLEGTPHSRRKPQPAATADPPSLEPNRPHRPSHVGGRSAPGLGRPPPGWMPFSYRVQTLVREWRRRREAPSPQCAFNMSMHLLILRFARGHAFCCGLHRPTSRVIHR